MRIAMLLTTVCISFAVNARADDPPKPEPTKPFDFTGRLEAQVIDIRPRVSGTVTLIAAKDGETVKAGDLIAELDSRVLKIELEIAKAKLVKAETLLRAAEAKLERAKKLVASAVMTKEELSVAEADRDVAQAEVAAAKAELMRAQLNLSYTRVAAPAAGRLGQIKMSAGNFVRADDDILVSLVRMETLSVAFDVDEQSVLKMRQQIVKGSKIGVAVGFANEEGYPHKAEFRMTDPALDPKTGTLRFVATLPNAKDEFIPGQFTRVRVTLEPGK